MRSTSTSSSPAARGLFRLLVGAGLVRLAWKGFWTWALPPKRRGVIDLVRGNEILKTMYLEPLRSQLNFEVNGLLNLTRQDVNRQAFGSGLGHVAYVPPTKWQQRKRRAIAWAKGFKPVIMTQRQKEDLKYYD